MIVITAPTSSIGKKVLSHVLRSHATVRVIARNPDGLDPTDRMHLTVFEGSHGDRDVVARATEGADTVFWLIPNNPKASTLAEAYASFTQPGLAAMRAQGVRRIVSISGLGRGTAQADYAGAVSAMLENDDLIAASGISHRAVTCPSFFDNLLRQVRAIREKGVFFSAVDPTRKLPGCATADIAVTSAALLLDDGWSGVGHQAVLGPEDLSGDDMAAAIAAVLGKAVSCERIDYETSKQQSMGRGWSEAMAQGLTDMMRAKSQGLDNGEVRDHRNTTPTSFQQWCRDVLAAAVTE